MNTKKIEVYTDGSAPNNQNLQPNDPTSWAYVIKGLTSDDIKHAKAVKGKTNNNMELTAFIEAMKFLESQIPDTLSKYEIKVFSDSEYLVKGYNSRLTKWINSGWRNSDNKILPNLDEWKEINRLKSIFSTAVTLTQVKAHDTNVGNNRADELAHEAMK